MLLDRLRVILAPISIDRGVCCAASRRSQATWQQPTNYKSYSNRLRNSIYSYFKFLCYFTSVKYHLRPLILYYYLQKDRKYRNLKQNLHTARTIRPCYNFAPPFIDQTSVSITISVIIRLIAGLTANGFNPLHTSNGFDSIN